VKSLAIMQDLRYALRSLRNSPGLAAVAILSLALGIGANTAIFSLIDAVMLKSLPVSHPEELLQVTMATPQFFSNPIWEAIRNRQDVFTDVMAYGRWGMNLAAGGEARPADGLYVSGHYFDTLRVKPALGRVLAASDDWRGCPGAAVLSYNFWQQEYGGRRDLVGRTISLDGHPIPIVGVAERGFTGIDVGAKVEVFELMDELARSGAAILMVSSEMQELIAVADRILVMRQGRITGELPGRTTQEEILRYAALSPEATQ